MKDIQSQYDSRKIDIQKVGVKTVTYPIILKDKSQINQHTIASVDMYVNLPHQFKGTHMSRFIEILNECHGQIDLENFRIILERMKERLEAEAAHIELRFPFFLEHLIGKNLIDTRSYECIMHGSLNDQADIKLEIDIPLRDNTAKISGHEKQSHFDYGNVKIAVKFNHFIWIEELIMLVESAMGECLVDSSLSEQCTIEEINEKVGYTLRNQPAIKHVTVTTEKKSNGYTTFATTQI